jgi:ABC-type multidrug transport system permease subunit
MPDWLRIVNEWNPISYLIEAIRSLMVTGYDWALIGTAVLMTAVLGLILQVGTLWAFARLAR